MFDWLQYLNPSNWGGQNQYLTSNGITSQGLSELNSLLANKANFMGPSNSDIFKNGKWYQTYKLGKDTIYRNGDNFYNAQGNPLNIQMGFDGKAYSNGQNSLANNFANYGGLALQGIQALGGLYMGNKMYGLAKDQFNFQKDFANRNLANSMKTYNNALADRINSRYAFEGRSQADADDYLKKHSL